MKVILKEAFKYWRGGCRPEVYGPGEVDLPEEVAAAAEQCGMVDNTEAEAAAKAEADAKAKAEAEAAAKAPAKAKN